MKPLSDAETYYNSFSGQVKENLLQLREIIKKVAPDAEEIISYQMPAFKKSKVLVYFAACKKHIGFYPTPSPIEKFSLDLVRFNHSKSAIQFPYNEPLPEQLIMKIVRFRLKEIATKKL